ncbi:hypothetical protein [Parachlamydia acanthamoebae]|uniref:Uncharacterized protein n=1 Tax=Parachlamydia acanthamoebae TaxID=83552 RepID=A0A0C1ECB9_9BACT|nr:hypothetical protein [Parachlamydia acanthamoebae]KIA77693.1 hypothetical protein DB43_FX00020 [Parachlamydia acanthamoebae]
MTAYSKSSIFYIIFFPMGNEVFFENDKNFCSPLYRLSRCQLLKSLNNNCHMKKTAIFKRLVKLTILPGITLDRNATDRLGGTALHVFCKNTFDFDTGEKLVTQKILT